jgi:hypothetical protein
MKNNNDFIEHFDLIFTKETTTHSKISLKIEQGRKIFLVIKSMINLGAEERCVYTFNDITVVEYQKVQLERYSSYMSELAYTKYRAKEQEKRHDIIDKTAF